MFSFDDGLQGLVPIMIFAIPIVAIVGGITAGIVKNLGQQRLMELAQRERIAAIERGLDVTKLPPMPIMAADDDHPMVYASFADLAMRRSQGLMIGGLVTLFVGAGLIMFFLVMSPGEQNAWAIGLIPAMVGVALLLSSWLVRPKHRDLSSSPSPRP